MAEQKHNLTLTRWHKVAERINAEIKRLEGELRQIQERCAFDVQNKIAVREKVEDARTKMLCHLAFIQKLLGSVALIRTELAKANAKLGVSEHLAKMETANRELVILCNFVQNEESRRTSLDEFMQMESPKADDTTMSALRLRTSSATPVIALAANELDALSQAIASKRRQLHALTDQIADLNRSLISITLDEKVAEVAGLIKE